MKKLNLKKLTVTAILAAVAVVGSLFSFPVFGSKCAPVQHLVNVLCAVTVGPWWALAQAFIASLIRNLLGLGSPLAFPGSMCGALLGGLLYKYGKKLPFAYLGEVAGTGIIGGMLSYPVAYLVMGNKAAALFTFVVPFLISTCGGTLIAIIITLPLKKSGLLGRMKELGLKEEDYDFYLDLRKYGSARHAGFGLGFERCVMYLTGMGNIRDVIPFPRTVNNCEL